MRTVVCWAFIICGCVYSPSASSSTRTCLTTTVSLARFVVMCSVGMSWYVGLGIYGTLLIWCGVDESHWLDSGMHNWTFAGYNLILAGLFTYVCDWCVWDATGECISVMIFS